EAVTAARLRERCMHRTHGSAVRTAFPAPRWTAAGCLQALPARQKSQAISGSQCLPSSQKLYTLRGVSVVRVTATSIRNSRTYCGNGVGHAARGNGGLYAKTSIRIEKTIKG